MVLDKKQLAKTQCVVMMWFAGCSDCLVMSQNHNLCDYKLVEQRLQIITEISQDCGCNTHMIILVHLCVLWVMTTLNVDMHSILYFSFLSPFNGERKQKPENASRR